MSVRFAGVLSCRYLLTHMPTPFPTEQKERIEAAGGWVNHSRLHGILAVSRAFGDINYKFSNLRIAPAEDGSVGPDGKPVEQLVVGDGTPGSVEAGRSNILIAEPEVCRNVQCKPAAQHSKESHTVCACVCLTLHRLWLMQ